MEPIDLTGMMCLVCQQRTDKDAVHLFREEKPYGYAYYTGYTMHYDCMHPKKATPFAPIHDTYIKALIKANQALHLLQGGD